MWVGALNPGEVREVKVQTGVHPHDIDTVNQTIEVDLAGYQPDKLERVRLKYSFIAAGSAAPADDCKSH